MSYVSDNISLIRANPDIDEFNSGEVNNLESKAFWECSDCSFKQEEDDKIDSFDYDQGYNLDEVYDQ